MYWLIVTLVLNDVITPLPYPLEFSSEKLARAAAVDIAAEYMDSPIQIFWTVVKK